jgi:hypothetical protein
MTTESFAATVKEATFAICVLELAGAAGLEGYYQGKKYRYERILEKRVGHIIGNADGSIEDHSRVVHQEYYRVWPVAEDSYRETCSPKVFHKHFSPTPSV